MARGSAPSPASRHSGERGELQNNRLVRALHPFLFFRGTLVDISRWGLSSAGGRAIRGVGPWSSFARFLFLCPLGSIYLTGGVLFRHVLLDLRWHASVCIVCTPGGHHLSAM